MGAWFVLVSIGVVSFGAVAVRVIEVVIGAASSWVVGDKAVGEIEVVTGDLS